MKTIVVASLFNGQDSCGEQSLFTPLGKHKFDGVSPKNVSEENLQFSNISNFDNNRFAWFLMRVSYGQEQKVAKFLESKNIEYFLPLKKVERVVKGKKCSFQVSLVPNMLFVKSTKTILKQYVGKAPLTFFHHYYVPVYNEKGKMRRIGIKPLIIPDNQMEQFRNWHEIDDSNKYFVCDDRFNFKTNELVRVIKGNFMGFTGHICRIKGQNRVGVTIQGIGTIFTAYIPKMWLERIS